jgi:hypothetical protein
VGGFDIDGFEFKRSAAVADGRFVGLALDQHLPRLRLFAPGFHDSRAKSTPRSGASL